ncbi:hypothetical protein BBJ28_00006560 [Nothophytophthora sp. Chile5]|nr:hypothetical protein BBJ28_00006560 [Nothophytophthora sp. Chile5]
MMVFSRPTPTSLSPAAQQQTLRKLTELLHSCAENQSCADCTSRLKDSIWASTTVGAFLCIHCAGAHRKLGVHLSRVKSLHLDTWTDEEVAAMKGGNKSVNEEYSKHLDKWLETDSSLALQPNTGTDAREKCIRAKYEDRRFTKLPHSFAPPPLSEEKNQDNPENPEEPAPSSSSGSPAASSSLSSSPTTSTDQNQQRLPAHTARNEDPAVVKPGSVVEVTKRFLNYFVVLGRGPLAPNQNIEKTKSPTDIQFLPVVLDVFPEMYADSPLPTHIGEFAFPEGFALSKSYVAPVFFSFVLTNVSGVKIYVCALKFCEELHPLEVVSLLAPQSNRQRHRRRPSNVPTAASQNSESDSNQRTQLPQWVRDLSGDMANSPGPVFCPKCIIVTSHYPYFSAFRQFLQQVVLCSKHIGLLTPVTEALLAILVPFSWQGAYIPVLPTSLFDVIDAPVPFLVGTHSDCLKQVAGRTTSVVFVDLDHNRYVLPLYLPPQAFPNEEHLEPIGNFASDHGQTIPLATSYSESSMTDTLNSMYSIGKIKRGRRSSAAFSLQTASLASSPSASFSRMNPMPSRHSFSSAGSGMLSSRNDASGGLTDSRYNETDNFSTEGIRKAFLRFFVTLLKKYANYLVRTIPLIMLNPSPAHDKPGLESLFDSKRFLQDNFDAASRPFVAQLIGTQMFDRFIEDRVLNQQLPEVLFFDQSINQKLNRSLTLGKKKYDCSFLDDRSDEIQETFIAPPPSNIGLPDDGTVYKVRVLCRICSLRACRGSPGMFVLSLRLFHFLALRYGATMIQKIHRMHYASGKYRAQRKALLKLQFLARGYIVYARYKRAYRGFRRLQAQWRGSFYKRSYKEIKQKIVRLIVPTLIMITRWKNAMFEECRRKVYDRWDQYDTSLLYRSKFWLTFNQSDFFTIGVYLEEVNRLSACSCDANAAQDVCKDSPKAARVGGDGKRSNVRGATVTAIKHLIKPKKEHGQKAVEDVVSCREGGDTCGANADVCFLCVSPDNQASQIGTLDAELLTLKMKTHLVDLDDALLALVLSFAGARDVEAMATASRFVALHVLPQFPAIWRTLFAQQWKTLNFPLVGVADGTTRLELDARLRALFPRCAAKT